MELEDLEALFENGTKSFLRGDAVKALQELCGIGRSSSYDALKPDGKFGSHLCERLGLLSFSP